MKYILQILAILLGLSFSNSFAQKNIGIGVVLGEPTGLSGKIYTGSANAFDIAAAWSFEGEGHLLFQTDYVWHSSLSRTSSGIFNPYYGFGGRIIFSNDPTVGIRIPIGINYIFSSAPIDIFAEVVPILDLIKSTSFDLNGGVGVRFWF